MIDISKNKFIDDYQANTTLANERFYNGQLIVWFYAVFILIILKVNSTSFVTKLRLVT